MNLADLPLTKEYYPFHLFSKDKDNIRKLIEISIEKPEDAGDYNDEMIYLYGKTYKEVIYMKLLNPFEAGCDEEGLKELFFEEPLGKLFFTKWVDEIINKIGKDEIINKIGEDEITQILIQKIGKDKLLNIIEKLDKK